MITGMVVNGATLACRAIWLRPRQFPTKVFNPSISIVPRLGFRWERLMFRLVTDKNDDLPDTLDEADVTSHVGFFCRMHRIILLCFFATSKLSTRILVPSCGNEAHRPDIYEVAHAAKLNDCRSREIRQPAPVSDHGLYRHDAEA